MKKTRSLSPKKRAEALVLFGDARGHAKLIIHGRPTGDIDDRTCCGEGDVTVVRVILTRQFRLAEERGRRMALREVAERLRDEDAAAIATDAGCYRAAADIVAAMAGAPRG